MDAFYASVEQRDNPAYRGKPLVVGGDGPRSVVAAASYEARSFGVYSAMPMLTAKKKCKDLIIVTPRISYYKEVSDEIMDVFHDYTNLIEPLSLDEAFLDVTNNLINNPSATNIAKEIKLKIKQKTGLTASAGVSYNKFLAKMASDVMKPDGVFVITPQKAQDFIDNLEIRKFFGIGKATAIRMSDLGIKTGFDLRQKDLLYLIRHFGKSGAFYHSISQGVDNRNVSPFRLRKSIGAERTFIEDIILQNQIDDAIVKIGKEAFRRMNNKKLFGRTITIKVKYEDFTQITRSKSFKNFIDVESELLNHAYGIMKSIHLQKKVRLLGLSVSNLNNKACEAIQLSVQFPDFD